MVYISTLFLLYHNMDVWEITLQRVSNPAIEVRGGQRRKPESRMMLTGERRTNAVQAGEGSGRLPSKKRKMFEYPI